MVELCEGGQAEVRGLPVEDGEGQVGGGEVDAGEEEGERCGDDLELIEWLWGVHFWGFVLLCGEGECVWCCW